MNSTVNRDVGREVGHMSRGDLVNIVEVVPHPVEGRIRARIEQPAGWISLYNVRNSKNNKRYAKNIRTIFLEKSMFALL